MSKKGCSPDNSAMERFFGRLKVEFFYGRDWSGWSIHGFMDALDEYIHWYNEERIELSLGGMSPMRYRRSLGRDGRPAREPRGRGRSASRPATSYGRAATPASDGRRTALPRSRDRRVPQEGRGLVDVRAHDREAGRGCARAGGRKGEPSRPPRPRLPRRQGSPARFPGVPALPRAPWGRPIHVAAGRPMGRRARGILLRDAQARAGERQGLQDEGGAKQDVLEYIEPCYNRRRMRSSIGYNAPCDLERDVA